MTNTITDDDRLTGTRWRLDPEGSTAEFRVPTLWGLATVRGRFHRLDGYADADGSMELVIDAASLDTGNRQRDRHLRSADFFDCERHPDVRFRSTDLSSLDAGRIRVAGDLEAAGGER
jgi:polyisoprenoid-binding protein YceI